MAFEAGSTLGTFEITGHIGAGGMGEVYRARDTKLGRDVAIKTMPATLAGDADRLARFEREAKLLASLNHANIASVYNLDEHDGTLYIAMELVEGETLEARLRNGALSVDEALPVALQIAQALEAAHDKGVVHRDLKPANIMLTPDGVVKVLDFGLAKAFSGEPSEASPAHSPALSAAMTQQGLVLGTAGYMSPEQASGQATDQRADVWAFGVVVYEMLTGMPVFHGESVPHILAAVLQLDPDWDRLPANLHPRIRFMLERCLTKKPRNRYAGIADARADIEAVIRDPNDASLVAAAPLSPAPVWTAGRLTAAAAIVVAVAALSAGAVWFGVTPDAEPPRVTRFTIEPPVDATELRTVIGRLVALSPDGRRLSINSRQGIYIRELGALEARLIPGSEEANATGPFFTPDGMSLNFGGSGEPGVRRMSIDGGRISQAGGGMISGENWCGSAGPPDFFVDNDTRLMFCLRSPRGFNLVSDNGERALLLPWEEEDTIFGYPWLLPDGEFVLISAVTAQVPNWDDGDIRIVSLDSGESQVLIEGAGNARYLPTGHIVFVRGDVLYGVAFDPETRTVTSGEVPLIADMHRSLNREASFSISNNGTLAYVADRSPDTNADIVSSVLGSTRLERIGGDGSVTLIEADGRFTIQPRWSPDGSRLAVTSLNLDDSNSQAIFDIGVYDLERRGARIPVVNAVGSNPSYLWTHDGESIIYADADGISRRRADGSGAATRLWSVPANGTVRGGRLLAITPDSAVVLFDRIAQGSATLDLYRLALAEGSEPELVLGGPSNFSDAALSPDGRWLAYASDESGIDQVFVVPYPEADAYRVAVSTSGGTEPMWDPLQDRLYFRNGNDLLAADYQAEPRFSAGVPTTVIAGTFPPFRDDGPAPRQAKPTYAVAPDGESFALVRMDDPEARNVAPLEIVVVENWFEEVKARIPTE